MKIMLTIIFFLAMSTSVYYISRLLNCVSWMINPTSFKEGFEITKKDILSYNIVMIVSIILWSIIFYFKL